MGTQLFAARAMAEHGTPAGDCMICFEELDERNYVEYKCTEDGAWKAASLCEFCVEYLKGSQYKKYVDDLAKTTCAAEQRRLLADGPPVNIYEPHGMPCVCGTCEGRLEVAALWYASKGDVSPQLEGALTGEARMAFWEEQKKFRIQDEDDADDDADADADDDAEGGAEGGGE